MADATAHWAPDVLRDAGEDDGDIYVVGVRESLAPEAWSLLFIECDEDEDEETYCLVVDPGQATFYGGVVSCEISDSLLLLLRLSEEAAENLGTPSDMRFTLALDPAKLAMLRRGLFRVLTSGRSDAVPPHLAV
jgi:hypothetical protein